MVDFKTNDAGEYQIYNRKDYINRIIIKKELFVSNFKLKIQRFFIITGEFLFIFNYDHKMGCFLYALRIDMLKIKL